MGLSEIHKDSLALAKGHYENFPVASWLLPRRLRQPIAAIYAFARSADDLADEGEWTAAERLEALEQYADSLRRIENGETVDEPLFVALAEVIREHRLPMQPFYDLLSAFRQDVTRKRYGDFSELLDYCRRSANPVGRLLLHLQGAASEENLLLSDQVCSALQLINFLQDIDQDYVENGRIYLPEDEMRRYGVIEAHIAERRSDKAMGRLLELQIERTREMMLQGAALGKRLDGRFGLEIRLIIRGGLRILEKLSAQDGDLFSRPRLGRGDYAKMFWRALLKI